MTEHNNRFPWRRRRPLRRRTQPRPDVTSERSVIAKIVGAVVVRIIAEEVKDLLGDLWNDIDRFL